MKSDKERSYKKYLIRGGLAVCAVIGLGILFFFGVQIYVAQSAKDYLLSDASEAPVSDAVMILGAKVYSNGNPSPLLRERLDYGYELYSRGKAKKILVSGDHGQNDYDEVNAMREYLITKGVPIEDIFMDHAGFNTYDSMYRAKAVFCIETLLICTQEFHIGRAVYIARSLGIGRIRLSVRRQGDVRHDTVKTARKPCESESRHGYCHEKNAEVFRRRNPDRRQRR